MISPGATKDILPFFSLRVWTSRGLFTFVDARAAGSIGNAVVCNNSVLRENIGNGVQLNYPTWQTGQTTVRLYLIGDTAFSLSPTLMKIYTDNSNLTSQQEAFNYAQICSRRVVEFAFGRLKEQFSVVANCKSNEPTFVSQAALLCCALENLIECKDTAYLPCYANYAPAPLVAMEASPAVDIRNAIGYHIDNL